MKKAFVILAISAALVLMSAFAGAQTGRASTSPPLSQPLVREGDFAVTLADSLGLGAAANETEAESALSAAGIAPHNGWIADYPITPDIVGELQTAVGEAADTGTLAMGTDEALAAFQDVVNQYNLNVRTDTSGRETGDTSGTEYPDSEAVNSYYSDEGPPVVTYYAPPPDYAYLYTWVPYPFWWWDSWFPGFFVLVDFDLSVHHYGHDHGREYGHVSNHFRDQRTGRMLRIDPTNRFRGRTSPATGASRRSSPSARRGARATVSTPRAPSGQMPARAAGKEFRGYGGSRSSSGTRSSVFDRSVNRQIERSSNSRGSQSRSNAGQIRSGPVSQGGAPSGRTGAPPAGSGGSRGGWRR